MDRLIAELNKLADTTHAKRLAGFFKTGEGGYGAGDVFWGIRVPYVRQVARSHPNLDVSELRTLLDHRVHEIRQCALFIMIDQFKRSDAQLRQQLFDVYIQKAKEGRINNWDLVDVSAPRIVGGYLEDKDRSLLYQLAGSEKLWLQRIAVLATFYFIDRNDYKDALSLAEMLLQHKHDLIHKAVGWMLREVGKRNRQIEEKFLDEFSLSMPRTMLRYAIERFDQSSRQSYLSRQAS